MNAAAGARLNVNRGLETGPVEVKSAWTRIGGVNIEVIDTPSLESEAAENKIMGYLRKE